MRTSEQIKAEIEERFGFFPPFFSPAQENPQVLENLWQQTLSAYVGNPLSPLFKEKLSAYLSRYCAVPYSTICHSCSLHQLGMKAREVLQLLESPPPTETEIDKHINVLAAQAGELTVLSEMNAALEESLLYCSIFIFREHEWAQHIRSKLHCLLGSVNYQHLVSFVAYVKTCHVWMESFPEVAYEADKRAIDHLDALLEDEPGLADFFCNYQQRVRRECENRAEQLALSKERQRNEQALRESEERFRLLAENSTDMISRHTPEGIYLYVSPACRTLLGYAPVELIGHSAYEFFHLEDLTEITKTHSNALNLPDIYTVAYRLYCKDGSYIWFETTCRNIRDENTGAVIEIHAASRDITERKQVEEARRQSEEWLRNLVETTSDWVWEVNETAVYTYASPKVRDLLGYEPEEVLGLTPFHLMPHAEAKRVAGIFSSIVAAQQPFRCLENKNIHKDGRAVVLETSGVPFFDSDGKFRGYRGIDRDITERKASEEELERQNRRSQLFAEITLKIRQSLQLEEILETTVTEVQKILQADRVLILQLGANDLLKIVKEAVVPNWPSVLSQNITDNCFGAEYLQKYRQGRILAVESLENADLVPCLVEFLQRFGVKAKLVMPILLKEELWGLLIVHQCSSLRHWSSFETELLHQLADQIGVALAQSQLLEEESRHRHDLAAYNAELQQFAYVSSHDLQEPLRKIQAFGDRLKAQYSESLNDRGRDYLERMQNAASRMQILIEDLLTFSRVTSKAQPFVSVPLAQVTQEVLSDLEVRIQQTGGRVEVGELPEIDADPLQMRQLLQNLIGNALKFHRKESPPLVTIGSQLVKDTDSIETRSIASLQCQIIVQDNGIGFDLKYLDRIFNVFQRLHGRSEYEGTGMGLAICRKIAERHGGSITATSTPGLGATFIVTLPVKQHKGENA